MCRTLCYDVEEYWLYNILCTKNVLSSYDPSKRPLAKTSSYIHSHIDTGARVNSRAYFFPPRGLGKRRQNFITDGGKGCLQLKILVVLTDKTKRGGKRAVPLLTFFCHFLTGVRPTTNYFMIF